MKGAVFERARDVLGHVDDIITQENVRMKEKWPEANLEWRNTAFTHFFIPNGVIWSIKRGQASFSKNDKGCSVCPNHTPLLYLLYEPGTSNAWAIWNKDPPDLVNYRSWYTKVLSFKVINTVFFPAYPLPSRPTPLPFHVFNVFV